MLPHTFKDFSVLRTQEYFNKTDLPPENSSKKLYIPVIYEYISKLVPKPVATKMHLFFLQSWFVREIRSEWLCRVTDVATIDFLNTSKTLIFLRSLQGRSDKMVKHVSVCRFFLRIAFFISPFFLMAPSKPTSSSPRTPSPLSVPACSLSPSLLSPCATQLEYSCVCKPKSESRSEKPKKFVTRS